MKIKKYIPFALLLMLSVGCSEEFTELTPKGSTTYTNFWKTEQDAVAASNALYTHMYNGEMFGRGFFWFINASDDMVTGRSNATAENIRYFRTTGGDSYIRNIYGNLYQIIRRSNEIILNVPGIDMPENLKNRILGEAYFMRGFSYYYLAGYYGDQRAGLPLVTEENMGQDHFDRPASVVENYKLVESDLKKAAELLPLITTFSDADKGRAHKDAALGYLAKTYLFWARFDNSKWADAERAADAVATSGSGRALINTGNPEQDFASVFYIANNWSSEYIWSVVSGRQTGSILPGVMLENKGWGKYNGWGYFQPTLELYNEYEAADVHRRKATILEFGDELQYLGQKTRYASSNSLTGFQFNKYMEPYRYPVEEHLNANGDEPTTDLNVPLLRYSEILLIKAEAMIMQGKNGDEPLNLVRARVGLQPKTGATLADLKHERRVELAGEFADRHLDLVRWGDAQAAYRIAPHGRVHRDKTNPDSPYEVVELEAPRNYNPQVHHVWPIPPDVISNSNIAQNQGW
ncbi:RagB/SusD family nutrient uptake outer membrane protein [Pontibacter sp. 13R65]|uniref:RagB/SusD family nutrient uptake outer membrane protein n=1 Tax=Pontibacter sp. 13R65 TaxID=3127458 RepID=UPI00301B92B1